jgi:hypothetical protein
LPKGTTIEAREDNAQGTLPEGYLVLLTDSGPAYAGLHFALEDFQPENAHARS